MNFSWPNRAVGKAARRSATRIGIVGVAAVTVAGAAALAAPAMSAMAGTHTAKHATTTKMSGVSGYVGSKLTLAAKVTGSTPKGTVKFIWGHTTLCSATLSNGTAKCGHVFGGVGSLRVEALYTGNATHKASSAVATVKVLAVKTSVKVTASPAAAHTGQSVKLTAVLTPTASAGTVTFSVGATKLGSAKVVSGKATLTHTWTSAGARTVTAAYGGNATHAKSSGTTKVTVTVPATEGTTTTITITGDAYSPTLNWEKNGPVVVPFQVKNNVAGGAAPTGTVTLSDPPDIPDQPANPSFAGCTGTLTPGANGISTGECTVTTTPGVADPAPNSVWGFVLMRATYNPSSTTFATSNTGDTEYKILNYMPTDTTVGTADGTDTAAAGTVDLVADVTPGIGNPDNLNDAFSEQIETGAPGATGDTVSFTIDGAAVAACTGLKLQPPAGAAPPNFVDCDVPLAAGTHTVVATFSGDEYTTPSTSASIMVTVTG
jgi:hypothetical protein